MFQHQAEDRPSNVAYYVNLLCPFGYNEKLIQKVIINTFLNSKVNLYLKFFFVAQERNTIFLYISNVVMRLDLSNSKLLKRPAYLFEICHIFRVFQYNRSFISRTTASKSILTRFVN